jgi:CSLREA domain-containing protein
MHQRKFLFVRLVSIVLAATLLLGLYFTTPVSADDSESEPMPATATIIASDIPTNTPPETATEFPTSTPTEIPTELPSSTPTDLPPPAPTFTESPIAITETATSEITSEPSLDAPEPTSTLTPTATTEVNLLPEPALGMLYSDNFDSGDLSRWVINPGWTLFPQGIGQAMRVFDSNTALQYVSDNLSNIVVQTDFLVAYGSAQINVRESADRAYAVILESNGVVSLYRDGSLLQAVSVADFATAQWHTLRLSAIGDTLRVAVDGAEVIALRDSTSLIIGKISLTGVFTDGIDVTPPQNTILLDNFFLWVPADQMPTFSPTAMPSPTTTPMPESEVSSAAMVSAQSTCDPNASVTLASMGMGGVPANGRSLSPAISDDGRYVTFVSEATNLVAGDTNNRDDVFLYDRTTCTLSLISVAASGTISGSGDSVTPAISPDGRYVVFTSASNNLLPGTTSGAWSIYLRDTLTNTTSLISKAPDGAAPNGQSHHPTISSSGRYIAYQSQATNIAGTGTLSSGFYNILLYDTHTNQTVRISKIPDGTLPFGDSTFPKISANERYVTYTATGSNIIAGDTNSRSDIFVYDRQTDTTTRVSVASDGTQSNGDSSNVNISSDGSYVTFNSDASTLVAGVSGMTNVFLHDRVTGQTTLITKSVSGSPPGAGGGAPDMSTDSRYILFLSGANNLVYGDSNNFQDAFVYDRQSDTFTRATLRADGGEANGKVLFASISDDGNIAAYTSAAKNLVTGDTNNVDDLFIANLSAIAPPAPANLLTAAISKTEINLTWADASLNETDFRIERSIDGTNWTEIATVGANVTAFADSGLTCNTIYSYRVRVYRAGDSQYSVYSSVSSIRTQTCMPVQSGPIFIVNLTTDINDTTCTEDSCSLREAVIAARNYVGGATIILPAGTFTLSIAGKNEDAALTGDLDLAGNITITGAGATSTFIDGGQIDRVFHTMSNSTVAINNLTIQNGKLTVAGEKGGAMLVNANSVVTITRSHVRDNTAPVGGAFLLSYGAVVTLTESTVLLNTATVTGGAFGLEKSGSSSSTLNLIRSTVSANTAPQGALADVRNSHINATDSTANGNLYSVGAQVTSVNSIVGNALTTLPQDNGGPTWTIALTPDNSGYIGAGTGCGPTDQRGEPRNDGGCDLGAYESDYAPFLKNFTTRTVESTSNSLSENSIVQSNAVAITMRFSEDMSDPAGDTDPNDITNPANYTLISAGADNIVQTSVCAAAQGDDLSISVNTVTFDTASNVATLSINDGVPLLTGRYRLLVCGIGLHDLDGNQLDTNQDGVGADEIFTLNFTVTIPQPGPSFIVNTTDDTNDGTCGLVECSLREAIIAANALSGGTAVIQLPAGVYTLTRSGNDNTSAAGDLDVTKTVQIIGAGVSNTIIDGNQIDRVLHTFSGISVTLANMTIRNGRTSGTGGSGGAVLIESSQSVDLINVFITNNTAGDSGGGIAISGGNSTHVTISNSTISNNHTTGDANPASWGRGGGIFNWGVLSVVNTTISGNSSNRWGGGILNFGNTSLNNVTITGNTADSDHTLDGLGGGIYNPAGTNLLGIFKLKNTIIAGNTDLSGQAPDCGGTTNITSEDYNLIGTLTGCAKLGNMIAHNITGVDPHLGVLADNGGATQTHALLNGSPAINSGNPATCNAADQRGVYRPQGSTCDIGAYEFASVPFSAVPPAVINTKPLGGFNNVRQFEVSFSEVVLNPAGNSDTNDVTNTANYRLIQAGADTVFQTSTCDVLNGDDLGFTVDTVSYNHTTSTATLNVNGGVALVPNPYRLMVCSDIVDVDNNMIDGNFDGNGGDDYFRDYLLDAPQNGVTFTVNTTVDVSDGLCGVLHCSLRDAVQSANAILSGKPIINVPAGTYTLTLTGAAENYAATGDLDVNRSMTINGAGADVTLINGNGSDRVFHTRSGEIIIAGVTIQGGQAIAGESGGGIFNDAELTLNNSIVQNNSTVSGSGGGLYNNLSGAAEPDLLKLTNTIVRNNTANGGQGGAIDSRSDLVITGSTLSGNTSTATGGAIYNQSIFEINNSTLSGNSALRGGAIDNYSLNISMMPSKVTNTTISGNFALQSGGGIATSNRANTLLTNVTLSNNTSDSDVNGSGQGGGLYLDSLSTVTLRNTLIAKNVDMGGEASDCATEISGSTFTSQGNNLIGTLSGCLITGNIATNITGVNAQLGILQDNGGATATHALLTTSPAINAGNMTYCPAYDQRGVPRPVGVTCDIGAFEYSPLPPSQIPPIVLNIDTIVGTGDGQLAEGEFTNAPIQNFLISWDQDIFDATGDSDPADVTNPTNYRLLRPGSDGLYQTLVCGIVLGDDQAIAVTSATYANRVATISVNGGVNLAGGSYRLMICDTIQGVNGSSMDGNRDGQPGGIFSRNFTNDPLQTGSIINVTLVQDVNDGMCTALHCSLREAIRLANTSTIIVSINVPSGQYILSLGGRGEDSASGGDLDINKAITIQGSGASMTIIDGGALDRVFDVRSTVSSATIAGVTIRNGSDNTYAYGMGVMNRMNSQLIVRDSIIRDNSYTMYGGGVANLGSLTLLRTTVENNRATLGGGIYSTQSLTITDSTIRNNQASSSSTTSNGGGIYAEVLVTISGTTISGNQASSYGGGIYYYGFNTTGTRSIVNSTISGNRANSGGGGIAIRSNDYSAEIYFNNVTITANQGSGIYTNTGTAYIQNTIIFGNQGADLYGYFYSHGNNLIGNTGGVTIDGDTTGNIINSNPQLGPLQNNGGLTSTHALLAGSAAIDVGNTATCAATDQRSAVRPAGAGCDMGAYEAAGTISVPPVPARVVSVTTMYGALNEGQALTGFVAELQITFDKAMSNPAGNTSAGDVTNPLNYVLVGDGEDGIVQTVGCGSQGDDTAVSVDGVSYDSANKRAILTLNGAQQLPQNNYRLLVCDTLQDVDGLALDGNGDATSGGMFWRNFGVNPIPAGPVFTVTTTTDKNDGLCTLTDCSLREAIINANYVPGTQTIVIPTGTYILSIAGRDEDQSQIGDLDILDSLTITGSGAMSIIDGSQLDRVFHISVAVPVTISGITVQNGRVGGHAWQEDGGGILSENGSRLTLTNTLFRNNHADRGGAVMAYHNSSVNGTVLTVDQSVFTSNTSTTCSAIGTNIYRHSISVYISNSTFTNNAATTYGGAICSTFYMQISNSTIANNSSGGDGGGIGTSDNSLSIMNTTITGNTAAGNGGGITGGSNVSLNNVTLADNHANGDGGGLYAFYGTPHLKNTIVYGNTDGGNSSPDCAGTFSSEGYNLIGSLTGCTLTNNLTGNIINQNPGLGSLQDNGGSTPTRAIAANSAALDAGNNNNCMAADQRGMTRPQGVNCDIGAFELFVPPPPPSPAVLNTPLNGALIPDAEPILAWNTAPNAINYQVQVDNNSAFASPDADTVIKETNFMPGVLTDGTYVWRVRGTNSEAVSGQWSATRSFTVDTTAPAVPTLTLPAADGRVFAALPTWTWSAPAGAVRYQLQVSTTDDFGTTVIDTEVTSARFLATTPLPQGNYFWQVRSQDAAGNWSPYSDVGHFSFAINKLPTASGYSLDTTPTFTWYAYPAATLYQFQLSTDASFGSFIENYTTPTAAGLTYTPATPLTEGVYFWRVNVDLGSGMVVSPLPQIVTITPALPAAPVSNTPANAALVTSTTPELRWTGTTTMVGAPFSYEIQIDNDNLFRSPEVSAVVTSTSHIASLADGKYYWHVRTRNSFDVTGAWNAVRSFTVDTIAPDVPTLKLPAADGVVFAARPTWTWSASVGAVRYQLQVSTTDDFETSVIDTEVTSARFQATASLPQGSYFWQVRSQDAAGNWSAYSDIGHFSFALNKLPAANGYSLDTTPSFTWYAYPAATRYQFQLSTDASFGSFIENYITPTAAGLTYTPATPLAEGVYFWRVNIDLGSGWVVSPLSQMVTITPALPAAPVSNTPANAALVSTATPELRWTGTTTMVGAPFSYEIQIDNDNLYRSPEATAVVTSTTYTATVLPDGKYYWRVRTRNYLGIPGAWNAVRSFTVDTIAPNVPTLMLPAVNGIVFAARPTWTWSTSVGAVRYKLQVSPTGDFNTTVIDIEVTSARFLATASLPQGIYSWRVRSQDAAGNWSAYSDVGHFSFTLNKLPAASGYSLDTTPSFTWYSYPAATRYQLQLSTDANFGSFIENYTTPTAAGLTYTPAMPLAQGVYFWRVNIDLGSGWVVSPLSQMVTITPALPAAPVATTPANAALVNTATPEIHWTGTTTMVGAPFSYEIQIDNDNLFRSPEATAVVTSTSYTATVLPDGKYYWRVRTRNYLGIPGAWNAVRSFTVDGPN